MTYIEYMKQFTDRQTDDDNECKVTTLIIVALHVR